MAITEFQRREQYVARFTAQEKKLFLPIVHPCLENRPDKRPSSVMLVQELRRIESSLPTGGHVVASIEQLHQQLSIKKEECRKKDEVIREKDEVIREKDEVIREKDEVIREKDEVIRENDIALRERDAALVMKDEVIQSKVDVIKGKDEALQHLHRVILEKDEVISERDEALKENDIVMRTMQADIEQLRSENNRAGETRQQLAAKEVECEQKDEVVREKSATIEA